MSTEKTHLKKDTAAGNSESSDVVVIEKISIYQNRFLIVVGSLLATWFVIVAVAGKRNGGQHFESIAAYETEVGVGGGGAVDSIVPVTSTDSALNMDIFGIANSDSSCVVRYHLCAGAGRGNCCKGLECDGPLFGTCQLSNCAKRTHTCAGFGEGNCCDGCACMYNPMFGIPGQGQCCELSSLDDDNS